MIKPISRLEFKKVCDIAAVEMLKAVHNNMVLKGYEDRERFRLKTAEEIVEEARRLATT